MKRLIAIVALACLVVGVAWLVPSMSEGSGAKPATVRLTAEGLTAEFVLEKGPRLVVTTKGTPLAPGNYTIKALSVFKKDDKGKVWELRYAVPADAAGATLMVDEGQDKIVDPGPPVSFQGWCRQMDPPNQASVRLGFGCHGRYGGLLVQPMAYLGGRPAPGPAFKLVTSEGKVIHQAAFSVASTGSLSYDWKPGAFKGKYKVEIAATFGPFEWKQSNPETLFEVK
jgi:hypothetical protein